MKRIFAVLLTLVMCLALCACGKRSGFRQAEKMISGLGEITLESGEALDSIEDILKTLSPEELKELSNYREYKRARRDYDKLAEEDRLSKERQAQIDNAEALIAEIGEVTSESDEKIRAARSAYDALTPEQQAQIKDYSVLTAAEEALPLAHAEALVSKFDSIGEITLDSETELKELEGQYKALTDREKELVTNHELLDAAWEQYYKLYTESLIRVTDVSISPPDSAGGIELYFNFINNSEKVIKYLYFSVTFYNRVDDIVWSKYDNEPVSHCQLTGPYAQGEGLSGKSWHWGDYYNWDIDRVELVGLSVEYTDGTTITFNERMMPYVQY